MNKFVLGTGDTLLRYKEEVNQLGDHKTLAFHRFFPYGLKYFDIIPDFWTWQDPAAAVEGLQYLDALADEELTKFKKMTLVIPSFLVEDYNYFRLYMGTTPLRGSDFDDYVKILYSLKKKGIKIDVFKATTTKYLSLVPSSEPSLVGKDFHSDPSLRFGLDKVVYCTAEYDDERVMTCGTFKWGQENKVSSALFPVAYYLKAKNVFVIGFDLKGLRFHDHAHDATLERIDEASKNIEEFTKNYKSGQQFILDHSVLEKYGLSSDSDSDTTSRDLNEIEEFSEAVKEAEIFHAETQQPIELPVEKDEDGKVKAYRRGTHSAMGSEGHKLILSYIKKWADWAPHHRMNIFSVTDSKYTLINKALPYVPFKQALKLANE